MNTNTITTSSFLFFKIDGINVTTESIAQVTAAIKGTGPRVDYATFKALVPKLVSKTGEINPRRLAVIAKFEKDTAEWKLRHSLNSLKYQHAREQRKAAKKERIAAANGLAPIV